MNLLLALAKAALWGGGVGADRTGVLPAPHTADGLWPRCSPCTRTGVVLQRSSVATGGCRDIYLSVLRPGFILPAINSAQGS